MWNKKLTIKSVLLASYLIFHSHLGIISAQPTFSYFRKSPRLTRAATSFRYSNAIATYFFEIKLPENVGNSLKEVTINQQINSERIRFFPHQTRAFIQKDNRVEIPVDAELERSNNGKINQIQIKFRESVKPGETVTIALKARNPSFGGIYQFGVTAYPEGENPRGLYLGIGRIHFDRYDYFYFY